MKLFVLLSGAAQEMVKLLISIKLYSISLN